MVKAKTRRWIKLIHKGPSFPSPYKRLPSNVKLLYDGTALNLSPDAEEAAGFFAKIILSKHADFKSRSFKDRFFQDFRELLPSHVADRVVSFSKLNFKKIVDHFRWKALQKGKLQSKRDKARAKRELEERRNKHAFCKVQWNGKALKKEPLGVWAVEPPGIFRGREGNPMHGSIKLRIKPEDIIINCSRGCRIPCPNPRRDQWKEIIHDPELPWLAKYTNNLGQTKYITLGQTASIKIENDALKYDFAKSLGKDIRKIRLNYTKLMKSDDMRTKQLGAAMYFIDKFSLRVGNEKGSDEADTVGCCTLKCKHVQLRARQRIEFDFKGKDSIRFKKEFRVPPLVFSACRSIRTGKSNNTLFFDLVKADRLNNTLKKYKPGLSAKVFRTYTASMKFQQELSTKVRRDMSELDLKEVYNLSNLTIAKICNHKKAFNEASFQKTMAHQKQQIDQWEIKNQHIRAQINRTRNVDDRLVERLRKNERIQKKRKINYRIKGECKEFSLHTSLQNYIDPRITVAWCKKHNLPLETVWKKSLLSKYQWATNVNRNFKF